MFFFFSCEKKNGLCMSLAWTFTYLLNLKIKPDLVHGQELNCGKECSRRCQLASRQNLCHRACGTCCARCNCVPPGTSGNQEVCPCYANMTTRGGRKKCP
ncbi:hypothetical protein Pfo_017062 [Paulownia fortunei]|nr:hypothetical protein Pfo_017062 [Paulownia fortunei]